MKKTVAILFCSLAVLIGCLPMYAFAHPGRTDGKGGHTNRSTGEYHYHHGQPAHDHWDMDGDGAKDCPYDFDDKTDRSKGKSSTNSGSNSSISQNSTSVSAKEEDTQVLTEEVAKVPTFVYWVINWAISIIAIFTVWLQIKQK